MAGEATGKVPLRHTSGERVTVRLEAYVVDDASEPHTMGGSVGDLALSGYDVGAGVEELRGDSDYEYWVIVRAADKNRLLLSLIQERFGGPSATTSSFSAWLTEKGIPSHFESF